MLPLLLAAALSATSPAPTVLFDLPAELVEVSGMAYGASGTLYVHEDSGSDPVVTALTDGGEVRATYDLGVQARDWEDMAAGPDGTLLVADIGDNRGQREKGVLVHRFVEPVGQGATTVTPESTRLTYEDHPQDAEALLVHPRTGQTLVVTKGVLGTGVYAAPQPLAPGALTRVASVELRGTGTEGGPDIGQVAQRLVTGGSVSPDGRRVVLRTYTDAYVFAVPGEDLVAAFDTEPQVIALPGSEQGEAVTWAPDGSALVVTGEGDRVPVEQVALPGPPAVPAPPSTSPAAQDRGGEPRSYAPWLLGGTIVVGSVLILARIGRRRKGVRR